MYWDKLGKAKAFLEGIRSTCSPPAAQLSFDSFWAAGDVTADDQVSFEEFIQLFRRRDASVAMTAGHVVAA